MNQNLLWLAGTTAGDLYVNANTPCDGMHMPRELDRNDLDNVMSLLRNSGAARQAQTLESYRFGKRVEWRAVSTSDNTILIEARSHLDIPSLARDQFERNMITDTEAKKLTTSFDDISLVMTFIANGNNISFHDILFYVHCTCGRFKYYLLPDNALDIFSKNETIPRINLKYNDLDYDICYYW